MRENEPLVKFVNWDDWVDVYLKDKLVYSGHSIEPERLLELLSIQYLSVWVKDDEVECQTYKNFKDIPKASYE